MSINLPYTKEQLYEAFSIEVHAHKNTQAKLNEAYRELAFQRKINKAREFILKYFNTDSITVDRCLNKATIICFKKDMICVMNDEWIFYFGSERNSTFSRKEYKFMQEFDFKGKKLQANNLKAYKNHVKLVNGVHIWV